MSGECETVLGEGKLCSRTDCMYIGAHHKTTPMCTVPLSYYLKIDPGEQLALCEAVGDIIFV